MGKRNTFEGYLRTHGGRPRDVVQPAVVPCVLAITGIDATLAAAGILTGKTLPIGAIVLGVAVKGNGTGGTGPLLDVGLEHGTPVDNALVDGVAVDADSNTEIGAGATAGAQLGVVQTEQSEITVSDGGGTNATGGTFDLFITYTFDDDGVVNN
jgi:hypothetical protein